MVSADVGAAVDAAVMKMSGLLIFSAIAVHDRKITRAINTVTTAVFPLCPLLSGSFPQDGHLPQSSGTTALQFRQIISVLTAHSGCSFPDCISVKYIKTGLEPYKLTAENIYIFIYLFRKHTVISDGVRLNIQCPDFS